MCRSTDSSHPPRPISRSGFTTLELLVASAIMGVVAVLVLTTFSSQMKTYSTQKRISDVQEDARLASEIMVRDIRMAGFMVPARVGISTRDGGATDPDVLCVSDSSVISDASLDIAMESFDAASLAMALGGGTTSVTLVVADLDIDGDLVDDFRVDGGIIVSDGTMSHCARIISIVGGIIRFTPATPAGFTAALGPGIASPAVIYELTAAGLLRNFMLVSSVVEDVQIEFAVDIDGNGSIGAGEFPIHDLAGPGRQALANHLAGAPDNFRRRLVSIATASRNL